MNCKCKSLRDNLDIVLKRKSCNCAHWQYVETSDFIFWLSLNKNLISHCGLSFTRVLFIFILPRDASNLVYTFWLNWSFFLKILTHFQLWFFSPGTLVSSKSNTVESLRQKRPQTTDKCQSKKLKWTFGSGKLTRWFKVNIWF